MSDPAPPSSKPSSTSSIQRTSPSPPLKTHALIPAVLASCCLRQVRRHKSSYSANAAMVSRQVQTKCAGCLARGKGSAGCTSRSRRDANAAVEGILDHRHTELTKRLWPLLAADGRRRMTGAHCMHQPRPSRVCPPYTPPTPPYSTPPSHRVHARTQSNLIY